MVSRNLRFRFTLVSYNILSQKLLNEHIHLYTGCNPHDLEWPRRGHRIVSELLSNQADIICLQEVESDHLQSLYRPRLALYGYECLYKKKTGFKIDGCAIFYKSKSFNLLKYKGVEFNRTDVTYLLNRDNVGIIAVFQPRMETQSKSSHLVVANTHLLFNPKCGNIRLAQLKFFLTQLEEYSFNYYDTINNERCHHPTILCGDLNSSPDSEVSKFILKPKSSTNNLTTTQNVQSTNDNNNDIAPVELISRFNQMDLKTSSSQSRDTDKVQKIEPTKEQASLSTSSGLDSSGRFPNSNSLQMSYSESPKKDVNVSQSKEDHSNMPEASERVPLVPLSQYEHSLKFKSVYNAQKNKRQEYVSTFSTDLVDYIFYTHSVLRLNSYRELLTREQLKQLSPLPNSEFPSDHLSLEAKFTLK